MNSEELAEEVAEAIESCVKRVMGVGKEQYEDVAGKQKFEKISLPALLREALEELDDVMVYNVMLRIRMKNLLDAYEKSQKPLYPHITPTTGTGGIVSYPHTQWITYNPVYQKPTW